jgi:hypothetical protein
MPKFIVEMAEGRKLDDRVTLRPIDSSTIFPAIRSTAPINIAVLRIELPNTGETACYSTVQPNYDPRLETENCKPQVHYYLFSRKPQYAAANSNAE